VDTEFGGEYACVMVCGTQNAMLVRVTNCEREGSEEEIDFEAMSADGHRLSCGRFLAELCPACSGYQAGQSVCVRCTSLCVPACVKLPE